MGSALWELFTDGVNESQKEDVRWDGTALSWLLWQKDEHIAMSKLTSELNWRHKFGSVLIYECSSSEIIT